MTVIVTISPQSRASLAAKYKLSLPDTAKRLATFFRELGNTKDPHFFHCYNCLTKEYYRYIAKALYVMDLLAQICVLKYVSSSLGRLKIPSCVNTIIFFKQNLGTKMTTIK